MFKRNLAMILAIASFINPVLVLADEASQETSLTQHICNRYLISNFGVESTALTPPQVSEPEGAIAKLKKQLDPELKSLSSREVQEIAFHIVSHNSTFETNAIDSSCLDKLEVIGGAENGKNDIYSKIFGHSIVTRIGQAHAALTLCHPLTDVTTLRNRRNAIEYLGNNITTSETIDSILKNIAILEEKSLTPWTSKNLVKPEKLNESYFKR